MKATIKNNPQLLAFLRTHSEFEAADLILILLGNGQFIAATDWPLDILNAGAPPTTYYATKFGRWQRGPITSEASFSVNANTMSLKVTIPTDPVTDQPAAVFFPGTNAPMFQTVGSGLFDGATVWVFAVYAPLDFEVPNRHANGFDTSLGLETKFMGEITNISDLDKSQCTFEVADLFYRLNQNSPPNIIQSPCRWTLFDSHCTLSAAAFQVTGQVAAGSTQTVINTTAALGSVGTDALPYTLGIVKFTSGQNAGLAAKIKQQNSTTQFVLDVPFVLTINIGDQFILQPGCDLQQSTCGPSKYNNLIHFGGFPFTPQPEVVL
jgi:uncharacterized phage protein (TIGR02218 family)